MDFAVSAYHRVKMIENEKFDKYLDLAKELKRLWNITVTVIPIFVSVLAIILKSLGKRLKELEIRGRIKTIQTSDRQEYSRTQNVSFHSDSNERSPVKTGMKN